MGSYNVGRIHYIKSKEFDDGFFKLEILESPPTIIIVAYIDQDGNEVTPDRLIKKHNPCNIHVKGGRVKCAFYRQYRDDNMLCCTGCNHWNNGCTVKCLRCKLHLCSYADQRDKKTAQRLYKLRKYIRDYITDDSYYMPKEKWLKQIKRRKVKLYSFHRKVLLNLGESKHDKQGKII